MTNCKTWESTPWAKLFCSGALWSDSSFEGSSALHQGCQSHGWWLRQRQASWWWTWTSVPAAVESWSPESGSEGEPTACLGLLSSTTLAWWSWRLTVWPMRWPTSWPTWWRRYAMETFVIRHDFYGNNVRVGDGHGGWQGSRPTNACGATFCPNL